MARVHVVAVVLAAVVALIAKLGHEELHKKVVIGCDSEGNPAAWLYKYSKRIENEAFQSKNLASVVIPSSVNSIGHRAFSGNKLTSATIAFSVNSIGEREHSVRVVCLVCLTPSLLLV